MSVQNQGFFASVFSSVFATAHAEEEDKANDQQVAASGPESEEEEDKEDAPAAEEEEEEEEDEEPVDVMPEIRAQCEATPECAPAKKHFEHCEKKVRGGEGWEHEDCVEELWHLMHCVDACAAPKLWAKLV
ncbi:non-heme 11 kda protein of cytochrome bc1 complex [Phaffia rhodozyma]|uniref:Non-heme 11 kDa protein of cytochrome bc1 complex n=1 Tax=Phaffia rhodozyma TaxID=264483 RepID=A0A0F7SNS1_PHARH|nr:non-heme 11 kda protein of cytochrome bc1 complex [Phaffia rhodozyma]